MIEDELLRAVIENPDDDGPRLVYVDWLIQAGDPRGELIANRGADTSTELKAAWQLALGDTVTECLIVPRLDPALHQLVVERFGAALK